MGIQPSYTGEPESLALPKRIGRLEELANNLWWSWHEDGRQVFRSLDYAQWRASNHNPVKQLREMSPEKLNSTAKDPAFLELYDSVIRQFDIDMRGEHAWFNWTYPEKQDMSTAYFSAEFAIHGSLPIYAGGLGVLAGDICKEASDLGVPLVAIGFMYPQGYFRQRVSADGWQQEVYAQLNFNEAPISSCPWPQGCGPFVSLQLGNRLLQLSVWQVRVGRVNMYLLDTDITENEPQDRVLSARLYTADPEERMRQLIVLGTGGVRVLRLLGINPSVWHANEDHTAFMMLERLREEMEKRASFQDAIEKVRASTIFTTHTPIPSGHNIFPVQLMDRYSANFWGSLGIGRDAFLKLGQYDGLEPGKFSMTAFALRLAGQANAVSRLHGQVTRKMWHVLWPERGEEKTPIIHITNGVHLPTWQAPEIKNLCGEYLGEAFLDKQDDAELWKCVSDIPDDRFWEVRQLLKTRLIRGIQDRAQQRWVEESVPAEQVPAMGTMLDPYALTIIFARRFAEYKRPHLILHDIDRLKKIITDPLRPVQIIFAGKSHPADIASKELLKGVYHVAMDRGFQGRIAFVEDYDMQLARDLVRGGDIWLNNPRRLQEACGTSGIKASMNGVINLSVRDGWWAEGYNGTNGWAIEGFKGGGPSEEDGSDAEALYHLLENKIIPLYYERDRQGVPHRWIELSKEAIKSIIPLFSACRMMKDYTEKMYCLPSQPPNSGHDGFKGTGNS
ncbi:MAG: alpha-glucan family phosphorylase [Dehalococcoidales bacterium]|nr:alpha-glucan family phosphorylase [Dehalococcoidales bacterium]